MFVYGNPVRAEDFVGRGRELRNIARRIAHNGQSAAIVGEPRSGKTSLLNYISSTIGRNQVQKLTSSRLLFSYLDAHALPPHFGHADFWSQILEPLAKSAADCDTAYRRCKRTKFDVSSVKALLSCAHAAGIRIVVLVDEFDVIVHHRITEPQSFFGALRSLTTLSNGALALVLASRTPLSILENVAQRGAYTGSPYFNFVNQVTMGPLSTEDVDSILDRRPFSTEDRRYIHDVAGGHPYLVQAAAGALWSAREEHPDPRVQRIAAAAALNRETGATLADIWRRWPPAVRHVFMAVAIEHLGTLGSFRPTRALVDVDAFAAELDELREQGFVCADLETPSKWRVGPLLFLAWCAVELRKEASSKQRWTAWLAAQEWGASLSADERRAWVDHVPPLLLQAKVTIYGEDGALTVVAIRNPEPSIRPRRVAGDMMETVADSTIDWDFFLAHATADTEAAESLYNYLAGSCRVFLDSRCLLPGDDWDTALSRAQQRSLVTVVLISDSTEAAYYQREEVAAAIAFARRDPDKHRVVPIYLNSGSDGAAIPYGLRTKKKIALGNNFSLADAAEELLNLQRSLRGSR